MPQGSQDKGRTPYDMEVVELIDVLSNSGIRVREGSADRLTELARLIGRWNQSINLISRKDTERLVSYHFADSVSLLPIIAPQRGMRVLDIGGSNGLPGLVISSVCPDVDLLISDGRRKRAEFLEEACQVAGPGSGFEIGRVDGADFVSRHAESFDLILARAVTKLKLLLKWCLPLLKPGGALAAYKGSRCNTEVDTARKYFFASGGSLLTVIGSPLDKRYNPLRKFAIAIKSN